MRKHWQGQLALQIVLIAMTVASLFPFVLLIMASFSDEATIIQEGYSIFPSKLSLEAYSYLIGDAASIIRSYGITILVTVVGTVAGLAITSLMAYPLSRSDLPLRSPLAFIVFFTLLFNGGLVPTYLVYTEIFEFQDTLFALLIPYLLTNGFYVMLMRTFFITSIPKAVIESAFIDGATEFKIFYRIILQLSLPVLATIGLMQMISYWNDWFNGLIFITEPQLFSLQNLLNRMMTDIQFLSQSNLGGNTGQAAASIPQSTVRMAIAVIGVVPILIAYPFFQKYFVKGLTLGAVKG